MKKISFLFAIVLLAGMSFMSSCTKDSTTTAPTIMLNAGQGYTGTDVTVPVNTTLKVGVIAQSTDAKLTNLKIIQTVDGTLTTIEDTTFSLDSYNRDYSITSAPVAGVVKLTFKVTDANGETAEASFSITTTAPTINTYTAVLLGGQLNPNLGSFYSTLDNEVMKIAVARVNTAKADMVFYYGTTLKASIVAISDSQLGGVPEFMECESWGVRNATQFKLTTGINWADIATEADITAAATGFTGTHVNDLQVGDIVAFETASTSSNPSKKGLYKVMELAGASGTTRSITIEVKIVN